MNKTGIAILTKFQRRWQILLWLESVLYALGIAVCLGLLFASFNVFVFAFFLAFIIAIFLKTPWRIELKDVCQLFDQNSSQLEFSTNLVLEQNKQLSGLARIQQLKISELLKDIEPKIRPNHHIEKALIIALLLVGLGGISYYFQAYQFWSFSSENIPSENTIVLQPTESVVEINAIPTINTQEVIVKYPSYTKMASKRYSTMDFKVLEGSQATWKLSFDGPVNTVNIVLNGENLTLSKNNQIFSGKKYLEQSGFYNFRFRDALDNTYVSELYSIDVFSDNSPVIEIKDLKAYATYNFDDEKSFTLNTQITDDYGLEKAFIVATVSRGKGESVKFREQQLNFDKSVISGQKITNLSKQLNLDSLDMEPGDELYFYVQAQDLKQPNPNISRSETYFAVIKDTLDYGPGVDAGLGVDLMPDYFRSQRQLIIDTKKLISERGKIPTKEFNQRSNDLGFDQKALRLKYGKFMGDENESQMQPGSSDLSDLNTNTENTLEDYTHDHDGDNEHNLVDDGHDHDHDHSNEQGSDGQEGKDLLEEYLHNHSDPESATLYADNLKQKLRKALSIMWDAELQLRLNEPEASLPYQYRALKLIQDIKNSARIYVHRIGFDPPPIKEESRLSGDLDEIESYTQIDDFKITDAYENLRFTIRRLEQLKFQDDKVSVVDRKRFESAGNEIAKIAIESPSRYIEALRKLRKLIDIQQISKDEISDLQKELMQILPEKNPQPSKGKETNDQLNLLVLKELYD